MCSAINNCIEGLLCSYVTIHEKNSTSYNNSFKQLYLKLSVWAKVSAICGIGSISIGISEYLGNGVALLNTLRSLILARQFYNKHLPYISQELRTQ